MLNNRFSIRFGFLFLLLFCGFLLIGCAQKPSLSDSSNLDPTDTQRVSIYTVADATGDWGFPSPHGHYSRGPGVLRMSLLFDTLIWKDDKSFIPALAKSWEYIENEQAYLFKLQENVKWHDGRAFTGKDVAFTFSYFKKHPYGMVDTSAVAGVDVLDDYLVKIRLEEPLNSFLNRIAGGVPILPEHIWSGVDNPTDFAIKEGLIGTGPFKFGDYSREQGSYLYIGNEDYYLGAPRVQQLRFIKLNPQLVGAALERGEINFASVPPEMLGDQQNNSMQIIRGDNDMVVKLLLNHTKSPLDEIKFRQGLAYAINRQELVDIVKRGHGLAGSPGFLPPTSLWYNPEAEIYDFSPENALGIFNQMGYEFKDGQLIKDDQPVTLRLLFSPEHEREGQLLKRQLEKVGINLILTGSEAKTRDGLIQDWQFDLAIQSHGGLGSDPAFFGQMITSPVFNSARYFANERLNILVKEQLTVMDEKLQTELVWEMQKLYADDLPSITLYYPNNYFMHDGQISYFNTWLGVAMGVPSPLNKTAFLVGKEKY